MSAVDAATTSAAEVLFIASQRRTAVSDLKAGQRVYVSDWTGWYQLAHDARDGFMAPGDGGRSANLVHLDFIASRKPLTFLEGTRLWVRETEEGDPVPMPDDEPAT